jgi:co-chaperonin GroES (HSP10)
VFLSSYAGDNEVTYEDDDLTIVDQSQILAVIE